MIDESLKSPEVCDVCGDHHCQVCGLPWAQGSAPRGQPHEAELCAKNRAKWAADYVVGMVHSGNEEAATRELERAERGGWLDDVAAIIEAMPEKDATPESPETPESRTDRE